MAKTKLPRDADELHNHTCPSDVLGQVPVPEGEPPQCDAMFDNCTHLEALGYVQSAEALLLPVLLTAQMFLTPLGHPHMLCSQTLAQPSAAAIKTRGDAIYWLWETHNQVRVRCGLTKGLVCEDSAQKAWGWRSCSASMPAYHRHWLHFGNG